MDDLLSEFLTECFEGLNTLDVELVRLEATPDDPALIGEIFRIVHTIKGTCGFLGLPRLEAVAHAAENVLGKLRDGEMKADADTVSAILESFDTIKGILDGLAANEQEPEGDDGALIARLDALASGKLAGAAPANDEAPESEIPFEPVPAKAAAPSEAEVPATAAPAAKSDAPAGTPKAGTGTPAPAREGAAQDISARSLRVSVNLLENLMTLVSELVLTRNQLLQLARQEPDSIFASSLQRLGHITSELQEEVMKTRMQPIGNAWSKLPRIIRDLALDLDKRIELEMHGEQTELDRQVLELIKDPLTHMVRNAADHGLETPAERVAAGKRETGTIRLGACHEGGHILIQISDDGRGLDVERIGAKAVAAGLCSEAELAAMPQQQIMQFIFKAGFSTASTVTNVSGRGVGMDVVRSNIEKIGGSVEIASEAGKGSVFTVKIPLTLAIVAALIVEAGGERFAIPQIGVVELVRAGMERDHRIELVDGSAILRLRDRLLPLISLASFLGLKDGGFDPEALEDVHVVVAEVGTRRFGLIVDQVFDTEEIVVKPVAPILRHLPMYSGNTILGDGSVVMILDFNGLTAALGTTTTEAAETLEAAGRDEAISLLLFKAGDGAPRAVPLALVTRIEHVAPEAIEWSGERTVVQYREQLMPLCDIHGQPVAGGSAERPVLVFTDCGRNMGLAVDEIVDITETTIRIENGGNAPGTLGSAIIDGRATDLLDVSHFVSSVFGGWFMADEIEPYDDGKPTGRRVLLVDDSAFIRNMLQPLLRGSGYDVQVVDGPAEALRLRDEGSMYDAIITDIEMPDMNGFAFAEAVRAEGPWQDVPIIALSSHATPADVARGRSVGFTDHVDKLNRTSLLEALARCATASPGRGNEGRH